ncbi:MAG: hypothetical protein EXS37_10080 [Opitutus sp.]|nr:hypothetical protein [Opitutus sp.]
MSASKKTIAKSIKSPAPTTKSVPVKPAARKASAPAVTAPPVKAASVAKPASSPVPAPKPVVKATAPKPVVTTIGAQIDIGFGNALFIRGEGAGLSWDQGLAMECVGANLWQVALSGSVRPFTFKFLVNDLSWSVGPDFTLASGANVVLTPEF